METLDCLALARGAGSASWGSGPRRRTHVSALFGASSSAAAVAHYSHCSSLRGETHGDNERLGVLDLDVEAERRVEPNPEGLDTLGLY